MDPTIDGQKPFRVVREQAHGLLAPERLEHRCRRLTGDASLDEVSFEWKEVELVMPKVERNLHPLLRFLSLQGPRRAKRVSPVAWQHINFYERCQFDADFTTIDFTQLRQQLSSEEVSRLYAAQDP